MLDVSAAEIVREEERQCRERTPTSRLRSLASCARCARARPFNQRAERTAGSSGAEASATTSLALKREGNIRLTTTASSLMPNSLASAARKPSVSLTAICSAVATAITPIELGSPSMRSIAAP